MREKLMNGIQFVSNFKLYILLANELNKNNLIKKDTHVKSKKNGSEKKTKILRNMFKTKNSS